LTEKTPSLTYAGAGVDVAGADRFVRRIASLARETHTPGVVPHRAEYAALFRPDWKGLSDPLIAATCDGVGTKLAIARETGWYDGLGQDLVAMNVNDLLPVGARPLFFLDYIAAGRLDPDAMTRVVQGMALACSDSGCALLGGETAEMPGVYAPGVFDLAGFAVGIVDASRVPKPDTVCAGDVVLGLPSSGVHSNGLSLARAAMRQAGLRYGDAVPGTGRMLGRELLEPTRLYVRPVLEFMERYPVRTAAHVTGGGIHARAKRLANAGHCVVLDPVAWKVPPVFDLIADAGSVSADEMARTFNMGLGYLLVVAKDVAREVLRDPGEWLEAGRIVEGEGFTMGSVHG